MRRIDFYNELHLGDCVYHTQYCRKLIEKNPDIEVHFYIPFQYSGEVQNFVNGYPIFLEPLENRPQHSINSWLNRTGKFWSEWTNRFAGMNDLIYLELWEEISRDLNIENPVKTANDHILDNIELSRPLNDEKYDWLVINSIGLSGQWDDYGSIDNFLDRLKNSGKTAITTNYNNYDFPCTIDRKYTIMDIGRLALNCKNVLSVHTAPFASALNKFSYEKVESFYLLQKQGLSYTLSKVINIRDGINIERINL